MYPVSTHPHIHTAILYIVFDVLLTVHLSIFILVINQLDAQNVVLHEIKLIVKQNFVHQVV